jgi:ankyrin repeat protein
LAHNPRRGLDAPTLHVNRLIHHAIRSRDYHSAISLLQRRDAISYKHFPVTSLCQHATLKVAKSVISQRLASGEKLIPEAVRAAAIRAVDGPALVEFLLDAGADVNAKSFSLDRNNRDVWMLGDRAGSSEETALMALCGTETNETVELWLRKDARKDLKDDYWKAALDYAKEVGRSDIIELLENSTSPKDNIL